MQGLQIGMFGTFQFYMEYKGFLNPYNISGAEIKDMDHHNVWLEDMEGCVYNVKKKNINLFLPTEK